MVLLGFGVLLILAIAGAFTVESRKVDLVDTVNPVPNDARYGRLLLIVWAVVNLAVAYLPVAFQRKMLMGEHVPLVILAGITLGRIPGHAWRTAMALVLLAVCPTNVF